MSEVISKIPFDSSSGKYRASWQTSQAEQDAYDDLMRRKVNPQKAEYVQNNELICFGMSEHNLEEIMPTWTPQAERQFAILRSWFPRRKMEEVTRPVYRSDFNWTNYATRAQVRCFLGLAVIRELPIKNFYARCALAYTWCIYFIIRGVGRGLKYNRPIIMYNHAIHAKTLANYPDLFTGMSVVSFQRILQYPMRIASGEHARTQCSTWLTRMCRDTDSEDLVMYSGTAA